MTAFLPPDMIDAQRLAALPSVLKALRGLTQTRFAALVRLTDQKWQACLVDDHASLGIRAGDVFPIEDTLCAQVREIHAPVNQPSVGPDMAGENTAHMARALGIRCHFSYPVFAADGAFFGALCLMDTTPHEPLSSAVVDAVAAFSQLVGTALSRTGRAASQDLPMGKASTAPDVGSTQAAKAPAPAAVPAAAEAEPSVQARVLSVMGHDLRNPMHSLMAAIEMIQLKPMEPRLERLMGMVQGSASRLSELARQTLDFTRLQMLGELPIQVMPSHDPVSGIKAVIEHVRASYPQREVQEDLQNCPSADIDPGRVDQALSSVLTHAIKHCGADQQVGVRALGRDGRLIVEVSVPGYILDAALLPHLFNPFAQRDGTAQTAHLGVGLYLARATALAHGGDLVARQTGTEVGFIFSLPITSE